MRHKRIRLLGDDFGKNLVIAATDTFCRSRPGRFPAQPQPTKPPAANSESGETMVIPEQRFCFNQGRQVLGGVLDHDLRPQACAFR
jgi:hypothetical protein